MNVFDAVIRSRAGQKPAADGENSAAPSGNCRAHGCPCSGSVDVGNTGKFLCSWHAFAAGEKWPALTEKLIEHRWLIDFIDALGAMQDGKRSAWVAKADEFCRTDEALAPQGLERTSWPMYCWRLREELAWRIGARHGDRPQPRMPDKERFAKDPRFAAWAAPDTEEE